jgi:transcriptional regulator with XRE-family HTH domain
VGEPGGGRDAGNALAQLILDRIAERGWSYGDVARRGGMPRSTVYNLARSAPLVRPPHPRTLESLATGLELPLEVVRSAAAAAAGFQVYDEDDVDPEVALLVASVGQLTDAERRHVAALVNSMLRARAKTAREGAAPD